MKNKLDSTSNSVGFDFKEEHSLHLYETWQAGSFHVFIHLTSFSIVSLSYVAHLCLVKVKMFH